MSAARSVNSSPCNDPRVWAMPDSSSSSVDVVSLRRVVCPPPFSVLVTFLVLSVAAAAADGSGGDRRPSMQWWFRGFGQEVQEARDAVLQSSAGMTLLNTPKADRPRWSRSTCTPARWPFAASSRCCSPSRLAQARLARCRCLLRSSASNSSSSPVRTIAFLYSARLSFFLSLS